MATIQEAYQIALAHHQAGRLAAAEQIYRRILAAEPNHADTLQLLGVMAHQRGDHATAVEYIQRAVAINPAAAVYHGNLGEAYRVLGKNREAMDSLRRAIELNPDFPEALNSLGLVLYEQDQPAEALACYQRALRLKPGYAEAQSNLGMVLERQGKLDEAMACYRRAIELNPNLAEAHGNLGSAWHACRKLPEAVACYQRSLELNPRSVETITKFGVALREMGRVDEAVALHRKAIELAPGYGMAHNNLGVALMDRGEMDEAQQCLRRAAQLSDYLPRFHSNLLYTLHFCDGYDARSIFEQHREWNRRHAEPLAAAIAPHRNDRSPERRLRVGYVSPDFRLHPIGRFLLPLLEAHDHRDFEIFCYSSVRVPDAITAGCRKAADVWREVMPLGDEPLAELVRQDQIDVLVDLTMHMSYNRMPLFARKPAPVQVTYLAYASTTGLTAIDYRLTDPYFDPPGADESVYSERSVRLPETYWCYRPMIAELEPGPRPVRTPGQVAFGSLNNFCKVTPPTLRAWCRLLRDVPDSRFLLHARPGSHRDRVRSFLAAEGVDPDRLTFVDLLSLPDYLRVYRQIDVALDPFPYGGGTTTCDAIWMGVPVVSLAGQTGVGRGGVSILSNLGLPELVARDVDDYVRIAAELVADLPRLDRLHATLRQRMEGSPLMDAPRFARNVEAAYRDMWRRWCEK